MSFVCVYYVFEKMVKYSYDLDDLSSFPTIQDAIKRIKKGKRTTSDVFGPKRPASQTE